MLKFNVQSGVYPDKTPDLNTSHVKVQLITLSNYFFSCFNLNTSHVKVQPKFNAVSKLDVSI